MQVIAARTWSWKTDRLLNTNEAFKLYYLVSWDNIWALILDWFWVWEPLLNIFCYTVESEPAQKTLCILDTSCNPLSPLQILRKRKVIPRTLRNSFMPSLFIFLSFPKNLFKGEKFKKTPKGCHLTFIISNSKNPQIYRNTHIWTYVRSPPFINIFSTH